MPNKSGRKRNEKVLEVLKKWGKGGAYIKGFRISDKTRFKLRRVVMAVRSLRKEGVSISAHPQKGYCLKPSSTNQVMESAETHRKRLKASIQLMMTDTVNENIRLLRRADAGDEDAKAILAVGAASRWCILLFL